MSEGSKSDVYSSIIRGVTVGDVVALLVIIGVTAYAGLRIAFLY